MPALGDFSLLASGKVREIYGLGERLLLVASDRISTYDSVHPSTVPDKGAVLTGISAFWFELTGAIVPNHVISVTDGVPAEVRGRGMIVRKLRMLPVECVVRGYLAGSGWTSYQASGTVSGISLPVGLRESDRLPEPIFTPTSKAASGHDQPLELERVAELLDGPKLAQRLRDTSIAVYRRCAEHARARGVILADSKFEFGLDAHGALTLADELCTPDSSRFWPADRYEPGHGQPSFDKQYVRDWASASGWDKTPPAPELPPDVISRTRAKYLEAYERITGEPFGAWLERTGAGTGARACAPVPTTASSGATAGAAEMPPGASTTASSAV